MQADRRGLKRLLEDDSKAAIPLMLDAIDAVVAQLSTRADVLIVSRELYGFVTQGGLPVANPMGPNAPQGNGPDAVQG